LRARAFSVLRRLRCTSCGRRDCTAGCRPGQGPGRSGPRARGCQRWGCWSSFLQRDRRCEMENKRETRKHVFLVLVVAPVRGARSRFDLRCSEHRRERVFPARLRSPDWPHVTESLFSPCSPSSSFQGSIIHPHPSSVPRQPLVISVMIGSFQFPASTGGQVTSFSENEPTVIPPHESNHKRWRMLSLPLSLPCLS